jgi:hypothetical protein
VVGVSRSLNLAIFVQGPLFDIKRHFFSKSSLLLYLSPQTVAISEEDNEELILKVND